MSSAKRPSRSFRCTQCGTAAVKWLGQCPTCEAWGTLDEEASQPVALRQVSAGPVAGPAQRLRDVGVLSVAPRPSGVAEFDRVLGGGLVPGSVVLLAGEPGVGKSTLLLAAAQEWADAGHGRVLIITGEETAPQVRLRADRIGATHENLYLAAETELSAVVAHLDQVRPELLIVDSVQTISDSTVEGSVGGVSQVRAVSAAITALAKSRGIACVLVGHVTKDGAVAGPRVLEHLVDVVLHFEGDAHSPLRMVRGVKNRFGAADEIGCFTMTESGITGVPDPSGVFLTAQRPAVAGTCSTVTMHGRRAMPLEIQALVGPPGSPASRTVSGLDSSRISMVLAVLQRWGRLPVTGREVLAGTIGGARVTEPAVDLAFAMAAWSSVRDIPLSGKLMVVGELGLSGEVRAVPQLAQRLAEAARLGFEHAIVPAAHTIEGSHRLRISPVADLQSAMRALSEDVPGVVNFA